VNDPYRYQVELMTNGLIRVFDLARHLSPRRPAHADAGRTAGRRTAADHHRGATMRRIRLIIAALCILIGLWLVPVQPQIDHVTFAGRPRALWRAVVPGLDIGIDTSPAAPRQAGYVEVWVYPHNADDYWPLLRMAGRPTPAPLREIQPGEVST
jgi:hypothetical protein